MYGSFEIDFTRKFRNQFKKLCFIVFSLVDKISAVVKISVLVTHFKGTDTQGFESVIQIDPQTV